MTPRIIHQPCGDEVVQTGSGTCTVDGKVVAVASLVGRKCYYCQRCKKTLLWPDLDLQYEKQAPEPKPANRVVVTVTTYYGDCEKPLTTDFPEFICATPHQAERVSNNIVRVIRQQFDRDAEILMKEPQSNHVQTT